MPASRACARWAATTLDGNKPPQARSLSTSGRTSRSGGGAAASGPASEPVASAQCRLRWFVATVSTAGAGCSLVPPRLPPSPGQGVPLAWESDATRRQLNRAPAPECGAAPEAAALFHWAAPLVCAIVLAPRQSRAAISEAHSGAAVSPYRGAPFFGGKSVLFVHGLRRRCYRRGKNPTDRCQSAATAAPDVILCGPAPGTAVVDR